MTGPNELTSTHQKWLDHFGDRGASDFVEMSDEPYISQLFATWLRTVAERLRDGGYSRLIDVPVERVPLVLHRWDGGAAGSEMRLAYVDAVVDLFGFMDAEELRSHACRGDVGESLAADLRRWATKLEGFELPRLAAAEPELRAVLIL